MRLHFAVEIFPERLKKKDVDKPNSHVLKGRETGADEQKSRESIHLKACLDNMELQLF